MNGYERIMCAFEGKKPDVTPVMLHNFLMAVKEAGFTHEQYRNNPRIIAETFIKAVEKYKYDGIVVDIDTATLAGAIGVPVDFPINDPARTHRGMLSDIIEVKHLKKVDIMSYRYVNIWLEAVSYLKDYFKNEIFIRGNCDQAPFTLASMVRGAQELMMDLYDEENNAMVVELLEYCTDIVSEFVTLMVKAGAHGVSNGDSTAGPAMISPAMYEQFAFPYEKRIIEQAHLLGVPYILHICGNATVIIEQMIRTGADGLELDYLTDVLLAHDTMKNTTVFSGNIDPSGVLAMGSEEIIVKEIQKLLEVFIDTNKFILSPGCAIPASTPSKNLETFIKTARQMNHKLF